MSYNLFNSTSAATDLIAQPGRAVNTFPSGLVRVDQTYLGLTANAAAHRAILAVGNDMPDGDTSPCLDGLKIFPEAQERRREDGWTEYMVSAYGRLKSTATIENRLVVYNRFALHITRNTVTAVIVAHEFPTFEELGIPTGSFSPKSIYLFNETTGVPEQGTFTFVSSSGFYEKYNFSFTAGSRDLYFISPGIEVKYELALDLPLAMSQRNFGYWTEWIFAYG